MRAARRGKAFLAALCACCLLPGPARTREEPEPSRRPWERILDWLRTEKDRFSADLEAARTALLERARSEDPAMARRLAAESLEPLAWGYGLVPAVDPSPPERAVVPRRTTFSLPRLTTRFSASFRDAALLARAAAEASADFEHQVAELERLRSRLRLLEKNISYHAHWQRNVADFPHHYAERNETIARVVEWRAAEEAGDAARAAELRRRISARVSRFRAVPGLRVEIREGGSRVLPLRLVTDIDDEAFLAELAAAVRESWVDSAAARERAFAVELSLERIPAARLYYPEGVPERGSRIRLDEHLDRFPAGRSGITTGARSTHVHRRFVLLGPTSISRRVLAHEVSHLLGFGDAYLRGYEGSPHDRLGCVIVEWAGLVDDLMSAPGYGRVSEAMVDRLIEAYSKP